MSKADAAAAYVRAGWRVGPIWWIDEEGSCACGTANCDHPGKHPIGKPGFAPRGFRDFSDHSKQVAGWWRRHPRANIGLLLPEGVIALDIDDPQRWADNGIALPDDGPWQETGSGGGRRQILYRLGERELDGLRLNTPIPETGAETKGDGRGYVLVAPSVTRAAYKWRRSGLVPSAPEDLVRLLRRPAARPPRGRLDEEDCCAVPPKIERDPGGYAWLLARNAHLRAAHGLTGASARTLLADCLRSMDPAYAPGEGEAIIDRILDYDEHNPERIELRGPADGGVPPRGIEPWPEPDEAMFHGVLGEIVHAVAPHTEADPVGVLGTLLAMFGSACGGARTLYQGSVQRSNLYVILVGETAFAGRKGTASDIGRSVLRLAQPGLEDLWLLGVASGEAVVAHLVRNAPEDRVLLFETEFARLLTVMGREGSTLSPVMRNAWDGAPLGYALARKSAGVVRHHVTLIGHITPSELRERLTVTDSLNGFANRLLLLAVRRPRLEPFPAQPDSLVQPYVERLALAIDEARRPAELRMDGAARELWRAFYEELEGTRQIGLAAAVTGRTDAQTARLALVYALADRDDRVRLPHLLAAIAFTDFARRSARWALGDSTGNRHADVLRRILSEQDEISWVDAKRELGLRTAADFSEVIDLLVGLGIADVVTKARTRGGRPPRAIRAKGAKGA